jgi:uncharacterized protein
MKITWEAHKNAANIRKHGVSFAKAMRIFEGKVIEDIDDREDYGEERIQAIGLVEDKEYYVVYANRPGGERRIISARRATRQERETYWQAIAPTRQE